MYVIFASAIDFRLNDFGNIAPKAHSTQQIKIVSRTIDKSTLYHTARAKFGYPSSSIYLKVGKNPSIGCRS